jgi:hypothetical protein
MNELAIPNLRRKLLDRVFVLEYRTPNHPPGVAAIEAQLIVADTLRAMALVLGDQEVLDSVERLIRAQELILEHARAVEEVNRG